MQVEEEREKGSCPFPCSLTSLLSMNCRARAQGLSQHFQTQSKCKHHHGVESTMLVESDGKVRLASSDNRTYSLDDYNLETFYRNSELKNLRPIHVVTSEPTLHLCLPPQPVVREEPSPTEQEQDSDVYFDFDLITPPDDYACAGESGNKTQESMTEENEKQERPESGCVTSVTSPIMFSVDFDLPPSNAPSPMDDCALEELNSRPDIDLETVSRLLVSSQNKALNEQSSQDRQFGVTGSNIPDFIGVVKGPRYPKTTSYSENSTSSTSECDSSSETGFNIPEEEKELISKEKNMSRNMSYYLPPPSSYQIFRNKERDMDTSESSQATKSKQRTTKTKHKKKKLKSHSPNKNESSGSRDSPLLTPELGIRLSSSPESSSIQSITLRENNKPRRHLIIRSNSADHVTKLGLGKKIKASHSFEKCACDSVSYSDKAVQNTFQKFSLGGHKSNENKFKSDTCSKEETLSQSPESRNKSNNKHSKNTNPDYDENIFKELSADDIKIKLEIEGGQAVSALNEDDILKEINEAIAILKNQYDNSLGEKLAKYESSDVDALGSKTDKKANCLEQVAVLSHTSPISATNECQKYESVSQLCEVCEEVPHFAPICVKNEKCDISIRHKILRFSSYDNSHSTNDLIASAESKMPKSKGRSKVKRASSETLSPQSPHEVRQLPEGARFPNDITLSSSSFNKDKNMECSNFYEKCDYPNPNKEVQLNNNNYDTCCALQYNSEINDCSVFHVESNFNSDVFSESLQEKNCFVLVKENNNVNNKSSSINGENGTEGSNDGASITGFVDTKDYENVPKNSCETLNSSSVVCENPFGCESQVISNFHSSTPLHILNKSNHNGLNETCPTTNTYYYSSDFLNTSKNETISNNLQREVENSSIQSCDTESRDPVTFNVQSLKCLALQSHEVDGKILPPNFVRNLENESADTKSTTTYKAEFKNFQPVSESDSDVMHEVSVSKSTIGDSSEKVILSENKNESEVFYNEEVLNDEIELLPSDFSETKTSDGKEVEEEESDEEILVSSRFRKVSTYTERIKRLSEDDDDDLPLPPTEIILIDYNEPSENPEEEISEEKNISADLTSELNKLSLTEPTIEDPSDESERSSEERETDVDLQQRIKRSSSLRCGKTPPGTPGRKKIVRFADALGLDLADIRTFLDGVPTVPPSAFCDLQVESEGGNVSSEYFQQNIPSYGSYTAAASAAAAVLQTQAQRILTPMFQQPGALPDFYNRLREQKVVLENVSIGNDLSVKGVVRVVNEDYHKRVYIRYTFDHWRNYHEATATYLDGSCDGFSDRFSFLLWGSFLQSNGSLVFCVKYCVKNKEYWDSNRGSNYVLHCYSAPPPHTLQGKPQNNGSIQQQEEQNSRHCLSHHSGLSGKDVSHYSSFMDSPNTPTDPWATKFF